MAHFALLDDNNIVQFVTVVSNDDLIDEHGDEVESLGIAVCEAIVGPGRWIQTSYNGSFRKQFAGIGFRYDENADVFICPQPPELSSWILNETYDWVPPFPEPTEGGPYVWDETTISWITIPIDEESNPLL